MSNVVNLNRFRKKKARADKEAQAEENRAKFGRSKTEKNIDEANDKKGEDFLDGCKRDDEPG